MGNIAGVVCLSKQYGVGPVGSDRNVVCKPGLHFNGVVKLLCLVVANY